MTMQDSITLGIAALWILMNFTGAAFTIRRLRSRGSKYGAKSAFFAPREYGLKWNDREGGPERWHEVPAQTSGSTVVRESGVTGEAIQVHGDYGFTEEFPVPRFYRGVRYGTLGGGTTETLKALIGRRVIAGVDPVDGIWDSGVLT